MRCVYPWTYQSEKLHQGFFAESLGEIVLGPRLIILTGRFTLLYIILTGRFTLLYIILTGRFTLLYIILTGRFTLLYIILTEDLHYLD